MLILGRKPKQKIIVGNNTVIEITTINNRDSIVHISVYDRDNPMKRKSFGLRKGETRQIGQATVTLRDLGHPNCAKVGVDAPANISIHREEIQKKIEAQNNREAA